MVLTVFRCFRCYLAFLLFRLDVGWLPMTGILTQVKVRVELMATIFLTRSSTKTTPTTQHHTCITVPVDASSAKQAVQHCRWTARTHINTALCTNYGYSESLSCVYIFIYLSMYKSPNTTIYRRHDMGLHITHTLQKRGFPSSKHSETMLC
jgi:hypothetical protein